MTSVNTSSLSSLWLQRVWPVFTFSCKRYSFSLYARLCCLPLHVVFLTILHTSMFCLPNWSPYTPPCCLPHYPTYLHVVFLIILHTSCFVSLTGHPTHLHVVFLTILHTSLSLFYRPECMNDPLLRSYIGIWEVWREEYISAFVSL